MTELVLSTDQVAALDKINAWASEPERKQFALAGYAGTGKTTIISRFMAETTHPVVVGTPTGKAAEVLRRKGVMADTIHRLAYQFRGWDDDGDLMFDYEGLSYEGVILVIDEASMVNDRIYTDLTGSGYKILFVGDHGQLPPVGGDPGIMRRPDFALEKVHRHDSELLDYAHAVRQDKRWSFSDDGDVRHITAGTHAVEAALREGDVVLCLRNATRHQINKMMLGRRLEQRIEDDAEVFQAMVGHEIPVICVQNNYRIGIFNGQPMTMSITNANDADLGCVIADLRVDERVKPGVMVNTDSFLSNPGELEHDDSMAQLDFGWALTCHKAQGSEFDHVVVIDETWRRFEHRVRWKYTAATRAKKRLTWIS